MADLETKDTWETQKKSTFNRFCEKIIHIIKKENRRKSIDDLTDLSEKEKFAVNATKRRSKHLRIYADKWTTWDWPTDAFLSIWTPKKELDDKKIKKFELELVRAISEAEEKELRITTDYGPWETLYPIAKKLEISKNYFPIKHLMVIDFNKNKIKHKNVYDSEWEEI